MPALTELNAAIVTASEAVTGEKSAVDAAPEVGPASGIHAGCNIIQTSEPIRLGKLQSAVRGGILGSLPYPHMAQGRRPSLSPKSIEKRMPAIFVALSLRGTRKI
jgi:hypothetical protein